MLSSQQHRMYASVWIQRERENAWMNDLLNSGPFAALELAPISTPIPTPRACYDWLVPSVASALPISVLRIMKLTKLHDSGLLAQLGSCWRR